MISLLPLPLLPLPSGRGEKDMSARNLKWGIYLSAALGFLSLSLMPGYSPVVIGIFLFALIPSWFIARNYEPFPGYTKAWNIASVLFLLLTLTILALHHKPTHIVFAYQLSFLQINKAFNPKKSKDALWMWILAFFMIVVTAVVTRSVLFPILLLSFLFLSVYTLMWLGINYEIERLSGYGNDSRLAPERRKLSAVFAFASRSALYGGETSARRACRRTLTASGLMALFLTVLIFLLIPRVAPRHYGVAIPDYADVKNQIVLTGFSMNIRLGSLHNLSKDFTPVMEMKLKGDDINESDLYLRGASFDIFSGISWLKSPTSRECTVHRIDPRTRRIWLDPGAHPSEGRLIRQEITYLDFPSRLIFALPGLVMLSASPGEAWENVFTDRSESCFILPPRKLTHYVAYSTNARTAPYHTPLANEGDWVNTNTAFTQVPQSLNKKRLTALSSKITGNATSAYEKARRIESYLLSDYQYSLRLGALRSDRPIEDFLFSIKAGHCELFATAMVMLLRTQGIPCRIVAGFHGGKYEPAEKKFIVRHCDAHTWAEVYSSKEGWQRFDPTPAPPMTIYAGRLYFKKLCDFFNALSEKWEGFVLGYNNRFQSALGKRIFKFLEGKIKPVFTGIRRSRSLARFSRNLRYPFIWVTAGVLLLLNLAVALLYIRWKRKGSRAVFSPQISPTRRLLIQLYVELVKAIAGGYVERPPQNTPREFIMVIGTKYGVPVSLLEEGTDIFYALRYGPAENASQLLKEIKLLLRRLHAIHKGIEN